MDIKSKIKSNLKEAELYRGQGLLTEAKSKYEETLELIRSRLQPQEGDKIAKAISERIIEIQKEIVRVEKKVLSPHMTKESQDLITEMFQASEGQDPNFAALEGAKALIKFGQFQRARDELEKLVEIDTLRGEAAKHIMNCFFLENQYDEALGKFEKWLSIGLFSENQIDALRKLIEKTFKAKGIDKKVPVKPKPKEVLSPKGMASGKRENEDFEEFDILASIKKTKKMSDFTKK